MSASKWIKHVTWIFLHCRYWLCFIKDYASSRQNLGSNFSLEMRQWSWIFLLTKQGVNGILVLTGRRVTNFLISQIVHTVYDGQVAWRHGHVAWTYSMDKQHWQAAWYASWTATCKCRVTFSMDMQHGHAAWTSSMDMQHGDTRGHAAWRHTWTCSMNMGKQNGNVDARGHGQSVSTQACIIDMDHGTCCMDMNMQHGHEHAAFWHVWRHGCGA